MTSLPPYPSSSFLSHGDTVAFNLPVQGTQIPQPFWTAVPPLLNEEVKLYEGRVEKKSRHKRLYCSQHMAGYFADSPRVIHFLIQSFAQYAKFSLIQFPLVCKGLGDSGAALVVRVPNAT